MRNIFVRVVTWRCKAYHTNSLSSDDYLRQWATWQILPTQVQNKLVNDTKKWIKRLLRNNGFVQENESRTALQDPEAAAYLELEVSGNEESGIEDNLDEEVGKGVDPLVNGPNEDD